MGSKSSKNAAVSGATTTTKRKGAKDSAKDVLRLDMFFMSRYEVDELLGDSPQKCGAFLLYEDADTRRTILALKSSSTAVEHHPITFHGDLYYLGNYAFPYLKSIVLYYRKHKLHCTRLTEQAFVEPYMAASRRIGRSPRPSRAHPEASSQPAHSPDLPRSHSFIAKYGLYRPCSSRIANSTASTTRESDQVI